jgi:hypothetical protein
MVYNNLKDKYFRKKSVKETNYDSKEQQNKLKGQQQQRNPNHFLFALIYYSKQFKTP